MTDVIDTANAHYDLWLQSQIKRQARQSGIATGRNDASDRNDCIDCGNAIGIVRKRALPHATRCIDCQTRMENRRKTY